MILKLTGAASALLMLVVLSTVGIGADEPKKDEKKKADRGDTYGLVKEYTEGKSIVITKKAKKGEEGMDKTYTIAADTEVVIETADKKVSPGNIAAIWLKKDSQDTAAKVRVFEKKKKAEKTAN